MALEERFRVWASVSAIVFGHCQVTPSYFYFNLRVYVVLLVNIWSLGFVVHKYIM
jgi:hypothetical protein